MTPPAPALWQDCIDFAQAHEAPWPRDPAADPARWGVHHDDPPPCNRLRGPAHPRGAVVSNSARDQARLGQLLLAGGRYEGRPLIPEAWVQQLRRPCALAAGVEDG